MKWSERHPALAGFLFFVLWQGGVIALIALALELKKPGFIFAALVWLFSAGTLLPDATKTERFVGLSLTLVTIILAAVL
jgi:hypothetical protein